MTNWQAKKLSELGTFSKGAGIPKDAVVQKGIPAVRYGELYTAFDTFIKDVRSYIDESTAMESRKIRRGDILFAGSGETIDEIGKSAVYQHSDFGYAGGDIVTLSPDSTSSSLFLAYALNSPTARKELRRLGQGQSVVHVYRKDLEGISLSIPEKPEQQRIVAVLEVWDEYLELLYRKIALKEQLKKGLMQQYFSIRQTDSSSTVLEDYVTSFSTGLNPRTNFKLGHGDNRYITIKNISNGNLNLKNAELVDDAAMSLIAKRSKLAIHDVIMSSIGNIGEAYLLKDNPIGWNINESVFSLKPNKEKLNPDYLYYLVTSEFAKRFFDNNMTGSSFKSIKMKDLKAMPIKKLSLGDQSEIVKVLRNVDEQLANLMWQESNIKEQKKYLLKNLISGTICTPENMHIKGAN